MFAKTINDSARGALLMNIASLTIGVCWSRKRWQSTQTMKTKTIIAHCDCVNETTNIVVLLSSNQKIFSQVALPLSALIFCLLLSLYRDFEKVKLALFQHFTVEPHSNRFAGNLHTLWGGRVRPFNFFSDRRLQSSIPCELIKKCFRISFPPLSGLECLHCSAIDSPSSFCQNVLQILQGRCLLAWLFTWLLSLRIVSPWALQPHALCHSTSASTLLRIFPFWDSALSPPQMSLSFTKHSSLPSWAQAWSPWSSQSSISTHTVGSRQEVEMREDRLLTRRL